LRLFAASDFQQFCPFPLLGGIIIVNAVMDDHALLREYLEHHSEKAFSELVERHLPLVYGTALRLARDPHAAQDVAQAVFIRLARKAWTIRNGHALPGWLYRATRHAAYAALRGEIRRRTRETAAMNLAEQNHPSSSIAEQIAPLLDEAMGCLSRVEQDALLLRYFQDQSLREVGAALGLNEDAARKRIDRALDKIRLHFSRCGITATAALLGTALTTNAATSPPVGLATTVAASSFAQAVGATGFIQAVWTASFMSTTSKVITTAVIVVLIASIGFSVHHRIVVRSNEQLAQKANAPSVLTSWPSLMKVQVASPTLPPAPASNLPQSAAEAQVIIIQQKQIAAAAALPAQKNTITTNLMELAAAGQQYMLDNDVTHVTYSDLVGTETSDYIRSITPAGNENYNDFILYQTTTQVTQVAPDGSIVTYNL
jgi:RNA polymerase sigma factor (sigma-70 family)